MPQSFDPADFTLARAGAGDRGWAWVSDEPTWEHPLQHARPGDFVRVSAPPLLTVDFELSNMLLTGWPGRLLRVKIVEPMSARDQPLSYATYVRAFAVEVEGEDSPALLFGPHGASVVPVLDAAVRLDRSAAGRLAEGLDPNARSAADRAWRAWMERRGETAEPYEDLSTTLLSGGNRPGSPIGRGLLLISGVVYARALAVDGDSARDSDEEDVWLLPPWNRAASALCDAAIALGAPDLIGDDDRKALLRAWDRLNG